MENIDVINNIKSIIKTNGLKQKYVAERAGFTPQEFSNILNGRKRLEVNYVHCVCNALNITPNELFESNAEKPKENKSA